MLSGERLNKILLILKVIHISFLWVIVPCSILLGQSDTIPDIILDEIAIQENMIEKYGIGSTVTAFDSLELSSYKTSDLAILLSEKTPIYLKTYGSGMLSTISFRGTGAQHTALLWNGININIPSLGQSDYSIIPLFGADKITVQFGGSSALVGTDALGGAIDFSTNLMPKKSKFSAMQSMGSFGRMVTNFQAILKSGKWFSKTHLLRRNADNDFSFKNITKAGFPTEKQKNASYQLTGLTQSIGYKLSKHTDISIHAWYNNSERQIQPTMSVESDDTQDDENFRLMGDFVSNRLKGKLSLKAAFFKDKIFFASDAVKSTSKMQQWVLQPEYEFEIGEWLSSRVGGKWNKFQTNIDGYGEERNEDRKSLFASFSYIKPQKPLQVTLNLRQVFVKGFDVPFTPSLGFNYKLLSNKSHILELRGSLAKNYRLPTLNERYWSPGGNPNIKPEHSYNKEIGLDYSFKKEQLQSDFKITLFHIKTDNRIFWLPENSVWTPRNLAEVTSKGLELFQEIIIVKTKTKYKLGGSYGYTKAITNKVDDEELENMLGKQLIYVPIHKINFHLTSSTNIWKLTFNGSFTSARRTTSGLELKEFFLADIYAKYKVNVTKRLITTAFFSVRNLLNLDYQNYENRAMPKRNFEIGFKIDL